MKINSFNELAYICKMIAVGYNTMCEIKEYPQYNFAQICFMTDKFGGTYTILHYDYGTDKLTKNFGHEDAMEIDSINCLFRVVWDDMQAELKARDLDEITALVNAEY